VSKEQAAPAESGGSDGSPRQTPAKIAIFVGVALVMTVLDQISKIWIRDNVPLYRKEIPVIDGFLSIIHAENPGAAFGFMNDSPYRMWVFAGFTVVALVVLARMFLELPEDDRFQNAALGMIVSGAVGNAIDRVRFQSVTDFVKMYVDHATLKPWLIDKFGTAEWPTYNVADVAIVLGLVMFGIHYLFLEKDEEMKPAPPEKALDVDTPPPAADALAETLPPAPSSASALDPAFSPEEDAAVTDPGGMDLLSKLAAESKAESSAADAASAADGGSPSDDIDEFEERATEVLKPVASAPRKKRNLADLGDD
jgi:signal peptidase II